MNAHVDISAFDPEAIRALKRIDLVANLLADGFQDGARRSRQHGLSTEFSDFKPYAPGDDVRFVDWRLYARCDKLFVKRFEAERDYEHVLLLDATASMAWRWRDGVTKLQYGANLLASIACICARARDRTGLVVHDGTGERIVPPRCHPDQLGMIFAALENLTPGNGPPLEGLARAAAHAKRYRGAVVVCSDLEDEEGVLAPRLESLARTKDRVYLLHILDRAEVDLPFSEATHLVDSETGKRLVVDVPAMRAGHRRAVEAFRARWRERCERWGVRYVAVRTDSDYLEVLLDLTGDA